MRIGALIKPQDSPFIILKKGPNWYRVPPKVANYTYMKC